MSAKITFGSNANKTVVSDRTKNILAEILEEAGLASCRITSTSRTPADQARVMFNNIVEFGVRAQKALYGSFGDAVIDEFVAGRKRNLSDQKIMELMRDKIVAVGPSRVSRHCADPAVLNVIDVAPSSIADKRAFEDAVDRALRGGRVSRFLQPPLDPAYHLEISQR